MLRWPFLALVKNPGQYCAGGGFGGEGRCVVTWCRDTAARRRCHFGLGREGDGIDHEVLSSGLSGRDTVLTDALVVGLSTLDGLVSVGAEPCKRREAASTFCPPCTAIVPFLVFTRRFWTADDADLRG